MSLGLCPVPINTLPANSHKIDLKAANRELAGLSLSERLQWANDKFASKIVLSTTFGPTAPLLLKLVADTIPDTTVVTVRHGYETPRTLKLANWYENKFSLNLRIYQAPKLQVPDENTPEFEVFKQRIKVEPFQRMLNELRPAVYISGVMRWQNAHRQNSSFIEDKGSVLSINPVLDLTEKDIDEFFARTDLPRNDDYYDPAKGIDQKGECGCNTNIYS